VANLDPVQVDEEMKSEYRQSVDQISSNMNIDSDLSSKQMSLIQSSGHKVYPDESLLETMGNLFPRTDTYPEPQVVLNDDESPIIDTVREIQSHAG